MLLSNAFLQSETVYTIMHDLSYNRDVLLSSLCSSVAQFRHQMALHLWGDDVSVDTDVPDIQRIFVNDRPLVEAFKIVRDFDASLAATVKQMKNVLLQHYADDISTHVEWIRSRLHEVINNEKNINAPEAVCLSCGARYPKNAPDVCNICDSKSFMIVTNFLGLA